MMVNDGVISVSRGCMYGFRVTRHNKTHTSIENGTITTEACSRRNVQNANLKPVNTACTYCKERTLVIDIMNKTIHMYDSAYSELGVKAVRVVNKGD
jgi:hypothetical protein